MKKRKEISKKTYFGRIFEESWNDKKNTPIYRLTSAEKNGEWIVDKNPYKDALNPMLGISNNHSGELINQLI